MGGPPGPLTTFNFRSLKSPLRATDAGDVESVPTLIVVPARAENAEEIEPLLQTLVSVTATAPDTMVLVVDDRSPARAGADDRGRRHRARLRLRPPAGRRRLAPPPSTSASRSPLEHGMDVCFVASGLVFESAGWLDRLRARTGTDGEPAAVAGGAVVEPDGHHPPRRLLLLALPPRLARAPGQRARGRARRRRPAAVPGRLRAAVRPQRVDRAGRPLRRAARRRRTPRWTTASASPRPAASASSSRRCAPARCETPSGEPDEASRDEQRLRLKHAARELLPLDARRCI